MSDTPQAADAAVTTPGSIGTEDHPSDANGTATTSTSDDGSDVDLEQIAADFDSVEDALRRLDEGTYWTDEVTGESIPDETLAADPIARRAR